ncbi:hypothetical protein IO90_08405 [Chryseobacterium sp. FH1]|nr:hypothetical protein IO90_08405 [Chryseobacterium sp. FH1]
MGKGIPPFRAGEKNSFRARKRIPSKIGLEHKKITFNQINFKDCLWRESITMSIKLSPKAIRKNKNKNENSNPQRNFPPFRVGRRNFSPFRVGEKKFPPFKFGARNFPPFRAGERKFPQRYLILYTPYFIHHT